MLFCYAFHSSTIPHFFHTHLACCWGVHLHSSRTSFSTLKLFYLICLSLAQPVRQPSSPPYLTQTLAENKGKNPKKLTLPNLIVQSNSCRDFLSYALYLTIYTCLHQISDRDLHRLCLVDSQKLQETLEIIQGIV